MAQKKSDSKWRSMEEVSAWVKEQGITSAAQWREKCKTPGWRPKDIPSSPPEAYKLNFPGWGAFLGTGEVAAKNRNFCSLDDASLWAKKNKITSASQWRDLCNTDGFRPDDIPSNPCQFYGKEFPGWGEFLGTGVKAPKHKTFRSVQEAAVWARAQGVKSQSDWFQRCNQKGWRPDDIPAGLSNVYGKSFLGWGWFLDPGATERKIKSFRPMSEAMVWAKEQKITSSTHWNKQCKIPGWRPDDIPADPSRIYKTSFLGWGHFLGTGAPTPGTRTFRTLAETSLWAREQGVTGSKHWTEQLKTVGWRPDDIPSNPAQFYGEEFVKQGGWVGFLGLKKHHGQSKVERMLRYVLNDIFEQEQTINQSSIHGFSGKKWRIDCAVEKHSIIVEYDGSYYHEGKIEQDTKKTADLMGAAQKWKVVRVRGGQLPLINPDLDIGISEKNDARVIIKKTLQHLAYLSKRGIFSFSPNEIRKINVWANDLLQSFDFRAALARYDGFKSFEDAVSWARAQNLKGSSDWYSKCKTPGWRPDDIPHSPDVSYRSQFKDAGGWGHFLGTGRVAHINKSHLSFAEVRSWLISMGIKSGSEWRKKIKTPGWKPDNIPANIDRVYKKEFNALGGWGGVLGTGGVATQQRVFRSVEEASKWAIEQKINSPLEWFEKIKTPGLKPYDIPVSPARVYKEKFKAIGGWPGFFGRKPRVLKQKI